MSRVDTAGMRAGRRGFGLIELLVAVAIVAILTATALPSFREMSRRMTVTGTTNDLVGALATARAEAAKRGAWVAVIGPGPDWSTGWHVEADAAVPPATPNRTFGDPSDVTIAQYAAVGTGYSVKAQVTNGNGGNARIVFGPNSEFRDLTKPSKLRVVEPLFTSKLETQRAEMFKSIPTWRVIRVTKEDTDF